MWRRVFFRATWHFAGAAANHRKRQTHSMALGAETQRPVRGEGTKPAFLGMKSDEQQNVLRKVIGGQFSAEKDDFMFMFHFQKDTETLLSYCVDEHGLKVNAMFNNS